jgi:hypothetical protein
MIGLTENIRIRTQLWWKLRYQFLTVCIVIKCNVKGNNHGNKHGYYVHKFYNLRTGYNQ